MASKRGIRRKACDGKKKCATLGEALEDARALRRTGDKITAYRCKFCRYYHVGHTPGRILKAMEER